MKKENKIKLSDLREIAIQAAAIPLYKAMGFKTDSKINRLAAEAIALIEYKIGDDLKKIEPEYNQKISKLRSAVFPQTLDVESLSEVELKALTNKLNRSIAEDEDLIEFNKQFQKLWDTEIKNEIDPIDIEEQDYSEKFKDERKKVTVMNVEYSVDGYSSLLTLVTKNIITLQT